MRNRNDWPQEIPKKPMLPRTSSCAQPPRLTFKQRRPGNAPAHLALIRLLPCSLCPANAHSDPHHLKFGPAYRERGFGMRATDKWAVPLCRFHHDEVEGRPSREEAAWWASYGFDAISLAQGLWNVRGDRARMLSVRDVHMRAAVQLRAALLRREAAVNALMAHRTMTRAEAEELFDAGLLK